MNFLRSLNSGISGAEIVRNNKKDISLTLESAVTSIGQVLEKDVSLVRQSHPEGIESVRIALVVGGKKITPSYSIFDIREAVDGYPIEIFYRDLEIFCSNHQDLESGIMELFEEPQFGLRILDIKESIDAS